MISISELMLKAGEYRDIPDYSLVKLGRSIQSVHKMAEHYPPQLLAEAYIDYKAREHEQVDAQGILTIVEVDSIENGFIEYLSCQRTY